MAQIDNRIIHLNNIRIKKNIRVKDLVEGICGDRHYRKYLSGETIIPEKQLRKFCKKLSISDRDFYFSLYEKDIFAYKKIQDLYINLINGKLNGYRKRSQMISASETLNQFDIRFLKFCDLKYEILNSKVLQETHIEKLKEICDFDTCFKRGVFDFVDIAVLLEIVSIEYKTSSKTLNLLLKVISNESIMYITSDSNRILPTIYSNLSIILGRQGKIDTSITIAKRGIKYALKHDIHSSLSSLYYSLSMGYIEKNNLELALKYAALCFSNVLSLDNQKTISMYYNLLLNDFNKNPYDIIKDSNKIK